MSKLPQSFDAKDWAKEFTEIAASKGITIDEDWMVTWFANAIMAGHDEAMRRTQAELDQRIAQKRLDAEAKAYERCKDYMAPGYVNVRLRFTKWAAEARERIANLQAAVGKE